MESKNKLSVLSLFDGIGTGRLILDQLEIPVEAYYASEIDEKAVSISARHYPDIIQLGDVNRIDFSSLPKIDLLLGGSPCQDVSIAGKREGLGGARSGLYKKYVEALEVLKPTYFLLENTKMRKEYMETISADLGVAPIELDSSLFSATARKRLYWFNFTATKELPRVEKTVQDILEDEKDIDKNVWLFQNALLFNCQLAKEEWESTLTRNERHGANPKWEYIFICPDGSEIVTTRFNDFCKEHSLNIGNMHETMRGKKGRTQHKGYKCSRRLSSKQ